MPNATHRRHKDSSDEMHSTKQISYGVVDRRYFIDRHDKSVWIHFHTRQIVASHKLNITIRLVVNDKEAHLHIWTEREKRFIAQSWCKKAENHHLQSFLLLHMYVQIGYPPIIVNYSAKQDTVQWPNVLKAKPVCQIYSWNCVSGVIYTKSWIAM